ncbi:copper transporter [Alkaliphilus transvaalensis]|uniref:copper transporter n=1 Tax=Alkaliphilus transvaalensis TaxID=114628 RepID=UPI00047C6521|nr:copper transporter [Alkaliphilus transvaalensis]
MVINMRYYVITIASIFLALGIGIFIGFNMDSDDLYLSQQQIIVDALEEKFSQLNMEKENFTKQIEELMVENQRNTSFIEKVYTEVTNNRLYGLNIGIIITSKDYYYHDIRTTLEASGANVPIEFLFTERIYNIEYEEILELNSAFNLSLKDEDDVLEVINDSIVYLLTFGISNEKLDYFIRNNFIQIKGNLLTLESSPVDYVVIAGGGLNPNKRIETLDLDIIRKCLKNYIPVVGVERQDVQYSYLPHYEGLNISTIDNINTTMGRISLIFHLENERPFMTSDHE